MPNQSPIAFFSYSREDSEFALRLANDLRAAGSAVWIDQLDIGPGERWDRVVQSALENCPSVLVILSPASVNSNNVMDEVSFALDQQKALIPVLYRDCDIPFRVRRFQHLDFRSNYEHMLEELKKCLHIAGQAKSATPAEAAAPAVAPPVIGAATPAPPDRVPAPAPFERSSPPAYPEPRPAPSSSFPAWAKIAIPVAVVVLAIVGYMLTRPKSPNPENTTNHTATMNAAGNAGGNSSSDPATTNRAALGSVELLGTGLAATESSPDKCALPGASHSDFAVTAASVWFFFAFRRGAPGDQWTVDWIEPNGSIHKTNELPHPGKSGRFCFEMKIAGTPVQNAPGDWTVRLNRNGSEVAERKFQITR